MTTNLLAFSGRVLERCFYAVCFNELMASAILGHSGSEGATCSPRSPPGPGMCSFVWDVTGTPVLWLLSGE